MIDTGFGPRNEMIAYARAQLIGPAGGPSEVIGELPSDRYAAGILYPVGTEFADFRPSSADVAEDPLAQTARYFPSAAGLSFVVPDHAEVRIVVRAARYVLDESGPPAADEVDDPSDDPDSDGSSESDGKKPKRKRPRWRHESIGDDASGSLTIVAAPGERTEPVLEDLARVHVSGRPTDGGVLMTVALVNAAEATSLPKGRNKSGPSKRTIAMHCLYQVELSAATTKGVLPYPSAQAGMSDVEDEELAFQYRSRPVYAIGHGASADWALDGARAELRTEFLPVSLVHSIRYDRPPSDPAAWRYDLRLLELDRLAAADDLRELLTPLSGAYASWMADEADEVASEKHDFAQTTVDRVAEKQRSALDRMRDGVELISDDAIAREAFQLACRAIADQMRRPGSDWPAERAPALRPFQLAFFLLVLPGLVDRARSDHDVVDLLWFPTGGGKTEAYLLLAAFEIFRRRLSQGGDDEGVVVLSRYTLRLLTTQQFQRTVSMACAAELIRREDPERLGSKPISVGLWVGGDHSPNSYSDAVKHWLADWLSGRKKLQLPECAWCGTSLIGKTAATSGIEADDWSMQLYCPSGDCPFAEPNVIPAHFVDEAVYETQPSIVIATVDKLAWLPMWGPERVGLLGGPGHTGPSLVLQDELHLLNGPLGTTAALYEVGIDRVLEAGPGRPKVIASTATIRRAAEQSAALFGRDLVLFPPNGFAPDDAYFSLTDPDKRRARAYLGIMSVGATWQATTVYAMTALAQGAAELPAADRDPYWTSIVYANSLQDHGRVANLVADDVRKRLVQLAPRVDDARKLREVIELRGAGDTATLIDVLQRLHRRVGERGAIDVVISTNLIQVGIDIPRLGQIVFIGQPKGVSEYIQASSRVGRVGDAPGLILTVFSHTRARDRSHFEAFRAFHDSLYRWVEPMSVTPFSTAALDRFLPAVYAMAVRHGTVASMQSDEGASHLGDHPGPEGAVRERIVARAAFADPTQESELEAQLSRLTGEWEEARDEDGSALVYYGGGKEHRQLLRVFGSNRGRWPVQSSMRSVEPDIPMYIHDLPDTPRSGR